MTGVAVGWIVSVLFLGVDLGPLSLIFGVALALAGLGLAEDIAGVPVLGRAATQLGLGLVLALGLCLLMDRSLGWVLPVTLAVAGYVNAANFMDGVDGMSALHGLVSGSYYLVVGLLLAQPSIALAGVVTAAAFAAFAPWNLARGRVFLGDVGSYLLGGLVVGCGAAVFLAGGSFLLAVAPALPYLADTGLTLARRARRGERVFEAHRGHIYQRLTDAGWPHVVSSAAVAAASVLCCGAALLAMGGGWAAAAGVLVLLLVLTGYLTAPRWAARELAEASA